jgi:hemerythrin-like domain-containing protein
MPETAPSLDINTRSGWPDQLQVLLKQYPRELWPSHDNLGPLARFWLDIHNGFRSYAALLQRSAGDFREGLVTAERFRAEFAPRLRVFLSHLEGHHQIEDFQFFPLFSAAEPRLVRGFEVLETDHEAIHAAMDRLAETANGFLQTAADDRDRMRFAGDAFIASGERLIRMLRRHLDDEEDLIIPLILERSEGGLGL